jgi:hypothetical protein
MPECTFCDRPAFGEKYVSPAMCEKHFALAIVVSLIESRGREATLDNVRIIVSRYAHTGLSLDEIDDLYASMIVRDGEHQHAQLAA